jgi:hypothetical protein
MMPWQRAPIMFIYWLINPMAHYMSALPIMWRGAYGSIKQTYITDFLHVMAVKCWFSMNPLSELMMLLPMRRCSKNGDAYGKSILFNHAIRNGRIYIKRLIGRIKEMGFRTRSQIGAFQNGGSLWDELAQILQKRSETRLFPHHLMPLMLSFRNAPKLLAWRVSGIPFVFMSSSQFSLPAGAAS